MQYFISRKRVCIPLLLNLISVSSTWCFLNLESGCNQTDHCTPWAIKRSQLIFVHNFVKKTTDFNAMFTARFKIEWHIWKYELQPPHLINLTTLPCENRKTENVTLQWDVTKQNWITNHSYIGIDHCHHALNLLVMVALWNRADHYIFKLCFFFFYLFSLPISAAADWMSAILLHMMWP